jgi:hypothetical protein
MRPEAVLLRDIKSTGMVEQDRLTKTTSAVPPLRSIVARCAEGASNEIRKPLKLSTVWPVVCPLGSCHSGGMRAMFAVEMLQGCLKAAYM